MGATDAAAAAAAAAAVAYPDARKLGRLKWSPSAVGAHLLVCLSNLALHPLIYTALFVRLCLRNIFIYR